MYKITKRMNAMKTILRIRTLTCVVLAVGALLSTPGADASDSDSYPSYLPAKVIAHLPLSGGARQMFSQQEGSKTISVRAAIFPARGYGD